MVLRPKNPMTRRTIEPLYEGVPFSDGFLKSGYSIAVDGEVYPGMVAAMCGEHEFQLSDGDVIGEGGDSGAFYGLFHHFYTVDCDDTASNTIPMAIWKGGGTYKVFTEALDENSTYEVPSSGVAELVAGSTAEGNKGKLIPRPEGNTNPTVAILLKVFPDAIEVELLPASHTY